MTSARFQYAPAPESRAIVTLKPSYGLFIGGEFVDPIDGGHFKTESPSSQEVLAEVSSAGPADVDRAVSAARRAQEEVWAPCLERSGRSTFSGSPASSRSAPANWRCSKASTTASRSRSPATSTSRSRRPISSIMRAGRTSLLTLVLALTPNPLA